MEVSVTKNNFDKEVLQSSLPVLIDFWASWCGPCRAAAPIVSEISEELEGKAKICKINVDEEDELATKFQIMSIPTFAVVKNGKVEQLVSGLHNKEFLLNLLGV